MNILIYQDLHERNIIKANVVNTINVAKGFQQNNYNVFYFAKAKKVKSYIKSQINCNIILTKNNYLLDKIKENNIDIIYCRDNDFPFYLIENNYSGKIILESHDPVVPNNIEILRKHKNLFFTSISPIIIKKFGIERNLLFPCSIDFEYFSNRANFRDDLFKNTKNNVVYCGHLYDYKGIPILLEVAERNRDLTFHLVGGKKEDIERHKKNAGDNVIFHGHQDYNNVPNYLYSSDILIIPYSVRGNKYSPSNITSPIKLFEYLSTKKPVICSNIIGIKNWISEDDAVFFKADDSNDLQEKIRYILENRSKDVVQKIINNGYKKAQNYTTKNKCKKLLDLIS